MPFTIPPANKIAGQAGFIPDIDNAYAALDAIAGINVQDTAYAGGAQGDGVTDDTAAIQAAVNAGMAFAPAGTYLVSSPISVPSNCGLRGVRGGIYELAGTIIKPSAGFSGSAVFTFPNPSLEQEISNLCIDGSAMPAGTAAGIGGITVNHSVLSVKLSDLLISGTGISFAVGQVFGGTSWRGTRIFALDTNNSGFSLGNAPDSTWTDCAALGCGGNGWTLNSSANSKFIGCRAEWSGADGFYLTTAWVSGTGSGVVQFLGCSTDRNAGNGVHIDATGTVPVLFSGLMTHRDGNGVGNAGVNVASGSTVIPVIIGNWTNFPGVNDDGTGTLTPQFALNVGGAVQYLGISNAFLHAATTATSGMTTGNNVSWRNVTTRTGSTATPGSITLAADSA